jgi:dihydrofolate synthase/folylpolyglutamate synthase
LDGLRQALTVLGDPQESLRSILVVGTNGKGSTAAMLAAVLSAHGVATGLYTSPHLIRVEERVQLDGRPVSAAELGRRLALLDRFADLTYFETLTAAAFEIFSDAGVEVAVLEAGMGGSWDATRLAGSAIVGLTNVGSDHRHWLGDDRRTIARDKGRALAAAERAVVSREVDHVLLADLNAPDAVPASSLVDCVGGPGSRVKLRWDDTEVTAEMPLLGTFQHANLQLGCPNSILNACWRDWGNCDGRVASARTGWRAARCSWIVPTISRRRVPWPIFLVTMTAGSISFSLVSTTNLSARWQRF